MKWWHNILASFVSLLIGGGLVMFVTLDSTRSKADSDAKAAEITTIVQRIDAYEKIMSSLNSNLTYYMESFYACVAEKDELKAEIVELRAEMQLLKKEVKSIKNEIAVYEN
ncbi:hypothetical protein LJC53_02890 [Bacteroidales bacterium OttesenSCG-928-C03]|nr:hypothetical protein [Bacteroidales bacterium OttesenSCG-928-C03]